jgi:hypothetical protein
MTTWHIASVRRLTETTTSYLIEPVRSSKSEVNPNLIAARYLIVIAFRRISNVTPIFSKTVRSNLYSKSILIELKIKNIYPK